MCTCRNNSICQNTWEPLHPLPLWDTPHVDEEDDLILRPHIRVVHSHDPGWSAREVDGGSLEGCTVSDQAHCFQRQAISIEALHGTTTMQVLRRSGPVIR